MKTVEIVGGGLAGLTLGLCLRQKGVPVNLFEAGTYPRHRVCGEYLSGRGPELLGSLVSPEKLLASGARRSLDLRMYRGADSLPSRPLPQPALCLSRHRLDALLAREFSSCGGQLHLQSRRTSEKAEGRVLATGRRPAVQEQGWRWIGLKAHAWDVSIDSGLEMHLTPHGYVGLCAVEENRTNVCGLFRTREPVPELARDWRHWLAGASGSALATRLHGVRWDEASFSAVSALALAPRRAAEQEGVRVGDALTMIPPLTGNGMSMAVEGAWGAAEPLAAWSSGDLDWSNCTSQIADHLDRAFASRLRWAEGLQQAVLHPLGQSLAWHLSSLLPFFSSLMFQKTR